MAIVGYVVSFLGKQLRLDTESDGEKIASEIRRCRRMKVLNLQGNTLGIPAGQVIAEALTWHPELERCLWSDLFTGRKKDEIPPTLKSMCGAIMDAGSRITELDLSDNAFGPIGAEGISDFLRSPSAYSLEILKLNNNGLGAGGKVIAECLITCSENAARDGRQFRLKTFVAGRNRLEDAGAIALADAFSKIGTLEVISIPQNGIRSKGICALAESVKKNRALRTIDFNDNTCGVDGAVAMAVALLETKHLEVLDLGDCLCRDNGIFAVMNAICDGMHNSLKMVNISGSELSAGMAMDILVTWMDRFNDTDVELILKNNCFGSKFAVLEELAKMADTSIDLGDEEDDDGTSSECESSSDMDISEDDDTGTVIEAPIHKPSLEQSPKLSEPSTTVSPVVVPLKFSPFGMDDLLRAVDGMSVRPRTTSLSHGDIVSFQDKQLKLNTAEDGQQVVAEIGAKRKVRVLNLQGNTLGIQAAEVIANALLNHPELECCLWSDLFTGRKKDEIPPVLRSMCSAMMQAACHIREVDLSDNAFGPIGAEGISEFLMSPSAYSLEVLRLNNNGLGAGGRVVADCLVKCHENADRDGRCFRLKTFVAGRNRLEDQGAIALAAAFLKIGTLEVISIPQNGIRAKGIIALAAALKKNTALREINFNDNTCGVEGAVAVADAISGLFMLEVVDLGDCLCRDHGVTAIVEALCDDQHYSLQTVDISGSELSADTCFEVLAMWMDAFNDMPNVELIAKTNCYGSRFEELVNITNGARTKIDLGDEDDDEGSAEECDSDEDILDNSVSSLVSEPSTTVSPTVVPLKYSPFGMDDLFRAVDSMSVRPRTTSLSHGDIVSFQDKQLKLNTAEDGQQIVAEIGAKRKVRVLNLQGNTLGIQAAEVIANALLNHPELECCLWSDLFTGRKKDEIPPVLRSMCSAMMQAARHIREVDLSDNAFGPIGAEGISEFLMSPSAYSLEVLRLNNNGLGAGGRVVADCLVKCHENADRDGRCFRLKTFVAGRNRLEDQGAIALAAAFLKIGTLEVISIPQNGIRAKGIIALAAALKKNTALREINFNDNTCGVEGAVAVADAISGLFMLEVVDLGDCLCRDHGVNAIVEALCDDQHYSLQTVDISGSELSADTCFEVLAMWMDAFNDMPNVELIAKTNCYGSRFEELVNITNGARTKIDLGDEDDDEGSAEECDSDEDILDNSVSSLVIDETY